MKNNKSSILKKSQLLFEQYGYTKTTLSDIAKSVGKVKTAIYYYFSGKEEIFAELVRVEAEEFYNSLVKEVDKEQSPTKKLKTYVDVRIELMTRIAGRYQFLKKEFFELMPIVEENREEYFQKEIDLIENILELGEIQNEFKLTSRKFSANMLVNTLKGLEIQMFVTDKVIIDQTNKENFRNFVLFGTIQQV